MNLNFRHRNKLRRYLEFTLWAPGVMAMPSLQEVRGGRYSIQAGIRENRI